MVQLLQFGKKDFLVDVLPRPFHAGGRTVKYNFKRGNYYFFLQYNPCNRILLHAKHVRNITKLTLYVTTKHQQQLHCQHLGFYFTSKYYKNYDKICCQSYFMTSLAIITSSLHKSNDGLASSVWEERFSSKCASPAFPSLS